MTRSRLSRWLGHRNVLMETSWWQCITLDTLSVGGFNGELGQPSSWVTSPRQVSGPVREVGAACLCRVQGEARSN